MVGVAGSSGLHGHSEPAGSGSSEPFAAERLMALQMQASGAVVRVTGEGCGATSVGTGFAVDGILATNSHLVSSARLVSVDAPSGGGWPVTVDVVRASAALDLAEIAVGSTAAWPERTELERGSAVVGERVLLAGYGGGQHLRFVEATVHLVVPGEAYGIGGEVVLIDGVSGPGFSGGPVLNRSGSVVAVLKGIDAATGLTVATSTAMLNQSPLFIDVQQEDKLCS